MVCDHEVYKNSVVTPTSKFCCENPHLPGAILMHLEEIVQDAEKPDTVAGLMRLLYATWPAVANIIMPTHVSGTQQERLREEDDQYFNDLKYDEVVGCMSNILRIIRELYPRNKMRPDEVLHETYSEITGLHSMPFDEQ
eukprot:6219790-Karenia_brevis.AAC.1